MFDWLSDAFAFIVGLFTVAIVFWGIMLILLSPGIVLLWLVWR